jgi:hypothetical protein
VSYQRPDIAAITELEALVQHASEEAAGWRRRSLMAEAEVARLREESGALGGPELRESRQRVVALEVENEELRKRVEAVRKKIAVLVQRLAFLERETVGEAS